MALMAVPEGTIWHVSRIGKKRWHKCILSGEIDFEE